MGEKWSVNQEEEDLHRRNLLRKARKGDEKATQELQEVYGVRLWSEQERATLIYESPKDIKPKARKSRPKNVRATHKDKG